MNDRFFGFIFEKLDDICLDHPASRNISSSGGKFYVEGDGGLAEMLQKEVKKCLVSILMRF